MTAKVAQRTPGPWHVGARGFHKNRIWSDGEEPIVSMLSFGTAPADLDETAQANAAFIVRACNSHDDLLATLKDARFALYGNGPGNPKIDAAIARAEE